MRGSARRQCWSVFFAGDWKVTARDALRGVRHFLSPSGRYQFFWLGHGTCWKHSSVATRHAIPSAPHFLAVFSHKTKITLYTTAPQLKILSAPPNGCSRSVIIDKHFKEVAKQLDEFRRELPAKMPSLRESVKYCSDTTDSIMEIQKELKELKELPV